MKKISFDEFEKLCSELLLTKKVLLYDADQPLFDGLNTHRYRLIFDRVEVSNFPQRISLAGQSGYVRFFFVDQIHLLSNKDGDLVFRITCGNTPCHKEPDCYILSFIEKNI